MSSRVNFSALRQLARLDWHGLEGHEYVPMRPAGDWQPIPIDTMQDLIDCGLAVLTMGFACATPRGLAKVGGRRGGRR